MGSAPTKEPGNENMGALSIKTGMRTATEETSCRGTQKKHLAEEHKRIIYAVLCFSSVECSLVNKSITRVEERKKKSNAGEQKSWEKYSGKKKKRSKSKVFSPKGIAVHNRLRRTQEEKKKVIKYA